MTQNYRRILFFQPPAASQVTVPVTLTDGTRGYLPARSFPKSSIARAHGLVCRRPLRRRSTARQTLCAHGLGWQVCRLDGSTHGLPFLADLTEVKDWATHYTGDTVAAEQAVRAAAAERHRARTAAWEAAEDAQAAPLGLRPWREADPMYREISQQTLRWAAGRSLVDCRDTVLVDNRLITLEDYLTNKEKILALGLEIIAAGGFHRPMS